MKILVKFPTRERPRQFLKALALAVKYQTTDKVEYLVSYDTDDHRFDAGLIEVIEKRFPTVVLKGGRSTGKIHAVNRDVATHKSDWDILVLMSDDMICQEHGWDAQLIREMEEHYPDTDGVLFHNDGHTQERLNTMCILGKKYYDRFGYIYHPSYRSLWCDNEFMEVANKLGRQTYFPEVLFKHDHPANGGSIANDDLYKRNDALYHTDRKNYEKRKRTNFA